MRFPRVPRGLSSPTLSLSTRWSGAEGSSVPWTGGQWSAAQRSGMAGGRRAIAAEGTEDTRDSVPSVRSPRSGDARSGRSNGGGPRGTVRVQGAVGRGLPRIRNRAVMKSPKWACRGKRKRQAIGMDPTTNPFSDAKRNQVARLPRGRPRCRRISAFALVSRRRRPCPSPWRAGTSRS